MAVRWMALGSTELLLRAYLGGDLRCRVDLYATMLSILVASWSRWYTEADVACRVPVNQAMLFKLA